jgi:hypothetical protein
MEVESIPQVNRPYPDYMPLGGVGTTAATPSSEALKNILENVKTEYPRFHKLPEFKKVKNDLPIALVGGGPSLKNNLEELRKFRTIMACGSCHDFLLENNIVPTYASVCDPDPITINYMKLKHLEVKYLIASACDPKVFKYLEDCPIVLWHCHSDDYVSHISEIEKGGEYQAVGGGCTIGLRSISIAITLGYRNIHFFGFDSCLNEDQSYAYELSTEEEKKNQGEVYNLKIGMSWDGPSEKTYKCLGYHLAQAEHFRKFMIEYQNMFIPTFHGEGLLPDLVNMIKSESLKMGLQEEARKKITELEQGTLQ